MSYTFDSALEDDLITVLERHDEQGSFAIRIGALHTIVFIELGRLMSSDETKAMVSHAIHTPEQDYPYGGGILVGRDPPSALLTAIDRLTQWYRIAVEKGHEPHESWLVRD